ncbi:uncharacterized protein KZ484_017515 isoform 2-T3 [Pholidichthys leucotaenia]
MSLTFGGQSLFQASQQSGTTIKFRPAIENDTMVIAGVTTAISIRHQHITAMKEYENKSVEELRLEDYQAGRKGPSNPMAAGIGSLFDQNTAMSSAATGLFSFFDKSTFGTPASTFGATTGSLFGDRNLFKPFGQTTTTQGLFGNTAASQFSGLSGTTQTSTAVGFGMGTGLFSQTNTGFGNIGTQGSLFNIKPISFGTTTATPLFGTTISSTPFFGTGTGLFGSKPTFNLETGTCTTTATPLFGTTTTNTATPLFGTATTSTPLFGTGTGLFGAKPAFNLGTGTGTTTATPLAFTTTATPLVGTTTTSTSLFCPTTTIAATPLFDITTTSAPFFGTGTGLFGAKPAFNLGTGTGTTTATLLVGTTGTTTTTTTAIPLVGTSSTLFFDTGTGLFGAKPALGLGTGTKTSAFGSAGNTGSCGLVGSGKVSQSVTSSTSIATVSSSVVPTVSLLQHGGPAPQQDGQSDHQRIAALETQVKELKARFHSEEEKRRAMEARISTVEEELGLKVEKGLQMPLSQRKEKDQKEMSDVQESVDEEMIHQESVPQESVHEDSVHQELVSQESVHQEMVPQEMVHEESVHEDSVHQGSVHLSCKQLLVLASEQHHRELRAVTQQRDGLQDRLERLQQKYSVLQHLWTTQREKLSELETKMEQMGAQATLMNIKQGDEDQPVAETETPGQSETTVSPELHQEEEHHSAAEPSTEEQKRHKTSEDHGAESAKASAESSEEDGEEEDIRGLPEEVLGGPGGEALQRRSGQGSRPPFSFSAVLRAAGTYVEGNEDVPLFPIPTGEDHEDLEA